MAYFKDTNNKVFWFDEEQVEAGLAKAMVKITESEKDLLTAYTPTIEEEILNKKYYLYRTDWIVTKILEEQIKGNDITPLLSKYEIELSERENVRTSINNLELQV